MSRWPQKIIDGAGEVEVVPAEAIREIRRVALSTVGGDDRLTGEQNQRRREALAYIIEITSRTLGGRYDDRCGRLLVGQGDDTYDPICWLPKGHEGICRPAPAEPEPERGADPISGTPYA